MRGGLRAIVRPAVPWLLAVIVVCGAGALGCGRIGYLARGGLAEARILWRREPIADLLARPDLDPDLARRLALVLRVRTFAGTLGLEVGDSFTTFADVDGEAVVWVVSAARRDRLEAHTWWYPVVGRVPYQGHFERAQAEAAAAALAARGLDVDVRPASAFSTLGWFADPLLSTTARSGPVVLAETVLHELFHATLYVPSAIDFNESAATFVGHRGAIAFFCDGAGRDPERCRESHGRWRRIRAHARLLERYARRLRALYAAALPEPERERVRAQLAARAAAAVQRRGLGSADELSPPNNARLLAMLAYETDLGAFERLAPTADGLAAAIARIVGAARGSRDPFAAVRALEEPALQTRRVGLDSTVPWQRRSPSPSTPCSDASRVGCASSGTTSPTARTCTARRSRRARVATAG
jgi:predicted aminopeptidase